MSRGPQAPVACRAALCLALLTLATLALAADPNPASATNSPVSMISLLQVLLALLVVLGAIGLFAWLMRRFTPGQSGARGLLKVVGGVMVGPRERLVVVEAGDTWLLLGVASGSVRLVHSMPKPVHAPDASSLPGDAFQRLLGKALGRKPTEGE